LAHKYNRRLTIADLRGPSLAAALADYHADPTPANLSTVCDALIERCASVSAAAVVGVHERGEGQAVEIAELWLKIDALEAAQAGDHGNR